MYLEECLMMVSRMDGVPLSIWVVMPEGGAKCRGVIQIVHGMKEYKERYLGVVEFFVGLGYSVIVHDCRGHGKSVRSNEDLGYFYEGGTKAYLDDILLVHELAMKRFPEIPMILFGHSMGSLGARVFLREYDSEFAAFVLSGSPSRRPEVGIGLLVAKMQKKLLGGRHKGRLLEALAFSSYVMPFWKERSPFAWICSLPEVTKEYADNPLCGFPFTVDGFLVLFELLKSTYEKPVATCKNPDLPIFFTGGSKDPCIHGEKKFQEAINFMRRAGYRNVEGKLYDGMRHEVCNEKNCNLVFQDIAVFLDTVLKNKSDCH